MKTRNKKKKSNEKENELKEYITLIYYEHECNFGYRKVHGELRRVYNIQISEKVVRRLMKELNFKSKARKPKNTRSVSGISSAGHIYENILNRDFAASELKEKWVTDVTEIPVGLDKLFVSAMMDLHNNRIVGYQISETHNIKLVEDTLNYALEMNLINKKIILHSDRGMPYRSNKWRELMDLHNITPSMSRKANALDNACIESFFSFLKCERKSLKTVTTIAEAEKIIHDYMFYYNHERIQGVLDYHTPATYIAAA